MQIKCNKFEYLQKLMRHTICFMQIMLVSTDHYREDYRRCCQGAPEIAETSAGTELLITINGHYHGLAGEQIKPECVGPVIYMDLGIVS